MWAGGERARHRHRSNVDLIVAATTGANSEVDKGDKSSPNLQAYVSKSMNKVATRMLSEGHEDEIDAL